MVEEVNAMKEMRRSDRAKHASNYKKHEEHSQNIEIKLEKGRFVNYMSIFMEKDF